jgi:hypothetical protein
LMVVNCPSRHPTAARRGAPVPPCLVSCQGMGAIASVDGSDLQSSRGCSGVRTQVRKPAIRRWPEAAFRDLLRSSPGSGRTTRRSLASATSQNSLPAAELLAGDGAVPVRGTVPAQRPEPSDHFRRLCTCVHFCVRTKTSSGASTVACWLGFCEQRMDRARADAMQALRPTPALALGYETMTVGLRRLNHAVAQRARHGPVLRRAQESSCCRWELSWGKARPCPTTPARSACGRWASVGRMNGLSSYRLRRRFVADARWPCR